MSANSFLIDTAQSMIIIDPNEFPLGLNKTTREDYPTQSAGAMLYEGKNILATPFGYRSYFEQSTRFNVGVLTDKKIQKIIAYQTTKLEQLLLALCEDGIYVANATEGSSFPWLRIVDLSAGEVANVRRLWTVAVVANKLLMYQQGQPKIWAMVDEATFLESATPSPISGATRAPVWPYPGTGLISYVPTFLNMAGQVGLFRADNRLGMWDSDGAVAWSSATYIEDFTPSAKTFAGITKFADVQGSIVNILGQGDGYVIYATKSIVRGVPLPSSPEKWRGQAITSDIGISFDTQVVASQPDDIHFCLTSAGMLMIKDGDSQYIITEVTDFLAKHNPLLSLSMIEGRYLFIHWSETFPSSIYSVEGKVVEDSTSNGFVLLPPVYPEIGSEDWWESNVNGSNGTTQGSLDTFEPIAGVTSPTTEPLVPCYNLKVFESTWADTAFSPNPTGSELLDSKITTGVTYLLEDFFTMPVVTVNSITEDTIAPGDFAGQDLIDKIKLGFDSWQKQLDYQAAWEAANGSSMAVDMFVSYPATPPGWDGTPIVVPWEEITLDQNTHPYLVDPANIKIEANECRARLFVDPDSKAVMQAKFSGTEEYLGQWYVQFGDQHTHTLPVTGISPSLPTSYTESNWYVAVPADNDIILAWKDAMLAEFGMGTYNPTAGTNYNGSLKANIYYVAYCLFYHEDRCIGGGAFADLAAIKALYASRASDNNPYWVNTWKNYVLTAAVVQWLDSISLGIPYAGYFPDGPVSGLGSGAYYGPFTAPGFADTYFKSVEWANAAYSGITQTSIPVQVAYQNASLIGSFGTPEPHIQGYRLKGTITTTFEVQNNFPSDYTIIDMELSGWGYTPKGMSIFRKTHKRVLGTTCPMPTSAYSTTIPDTDNLDPSVPEVLRPTTPNPPYQWDYPTSLPFDPAYALYKKGSLAPYYPKYKGAVIYDTLLQKFGRYDAEHYVVYPLMPVNRADEAVAPVKDTGMFAGCVDSAKYATIFKPNTRQAFATWGKLGYYRLGMTRLSELRAYFAEPAYGQLIVEGSLNGSTIEPSLSVAVDLAGQYNAILPFTSVAKWFNIRIEGQFNLTTLQINAEGRSRR